MPMLLWHLLPPQSSMCGLCLQVDGSPCAYASGVTLHDPVYCAHFAYTCLYLPILAYTCLYLPIFAYTCLY